MQVGRPVACYNCSKNKKRCVFLTPESVTCTVCARRRLACAGGQQRQQLNAQTPLATKSKTPAVARVGQSTLSWKLSTQALSFSLTHHLLSLHIRHRPPRMFGGMLEHEWDGIGDISLAVNGKVNDLSPVIQALVAIGLADGARLSTHSAIVGASDYPFPQFGAFKSVDGTLSALGRRRRDAVTALNARAMECLDLALCSPEGVDPSMKLQLLWIGTAVMVETPESRSWCREMSFRCAQYIFECLARDGLGDSERLRLYEQSYTVVMYESIRSALLGIESSLTQQEYITAVPYLSYPNPPVYNPNIDEIDAFLVPASSDTDFTLYHSLLERLFVPWRVRVIKVVFVFTYGQGKVTLNQLVSLMWEWMDQIWFWVGSIIARILSDPRFIEVERSRNTPQWESWVLIQMIWKQFFISESIYAGFLIGCHMLLVQGSPENKKDLLALSQKRCYRALRRMDFICGLRDIRRDFHEYDALLLSVQLIVQLPENGPCSNISLEEFPHLLQAFEFMSFSNFEWGDFLRTHGRKTIVPAAPILFADGTSLSNLPTEPFVIPWSILSPQNKPLLSLPPNETPSSLPTETDSEQQASQLVEATLASLSSPDPNVNLKLFRDKPESLPSPASSSASSSSAGDDSPTSPNTSLSSSSTEPSVTMAIEDILTKLLESSAKLEIAKEEVASDLVHATLKELSQGGVKETAKQKV